MSVRKMDVPDPVWAWIITLQAQLKAERGRRVTLAETFEYVMISYLAFEQVGEAARS